MQVYLTSAYSDVEPIGAFRRAAAADKYGVHRLTDDPAEADLILFAENSQYHNDRFFKILKNHPLVRQYPNKAFMYNPHDLPWLVLPGLYPSMPASLFDEASVAASPYMEQVNDRIRCDFAAEPQLLYSFCGNLRMPVRSELQQLQHPRGDVREAAQGLYLDHKPLEPLVAYANLLVDTKFMLCPRGIGSSSIRLFETMQAGRVPVVIADEWVRPKGPAWDDFAVFVPQNQIAQIPRLLESIEAQWPVMSRLARANWERYFAPDVIFHYFVEQLLPLRTTNKRMGFSLARSHDAQFARYYVRSKFLHPARNWVAALQQKR
jgi:hypothetical protein